MSVSEKSKVNVVLFDGVCNLCNGSVDFVIRHELKNTLKFASLQSEYGKEIIAKFNLEIVPDSILFFTDDQLYAKSGAVLRISQYLKNPVRLISVFRILPIKLMDKIYDIVARNRYKWFGKKDSCRIPTFEEKEKFLG